MRTPSGEMSTGLKKDSWSLEEDQKLVSYINRHGIWNWSHMPTFAGLSRTRKSCRLRWMNYLKPNIKRGNFSKEEEETILHSHLLPAIDGLQLQQDFLVGLITKSRTTGILISRNVGQTTFCIKQLIQTIRRYLRLNPMTLKYDYYDIGSPGTIEDLQWFWKQLCPIENLEHGNNYQDPFSDSNFQYSFHDSISLHSFYNHEFGI